MTKYQIPNTKYQIGFPGPPQVCVPMKDVRFAKSGYEIHENGEVEKWREKNRERILGAGTIGTCGTDVRLLRFDGHQLRGKLESSFDERS